MNEFSSTLALLSSDTGAILGFLLVLAVLLLILFRGEKREEPHVIAHDPPRYPSESPYHDSNRRKAAAAALALHRNPTQGDPS